MLYSLDGVEPAIPYTDLIVIAAQGATTLKYASIDIRGNVEATRTTVVRIDDDAPVTVDDVSSAWVRGRSTST